MPGRKAGLMRRERRRAEERERSSRFCVRVTGTSLRGRRGGARESATVSAFESLGQADYSGFFREMQVRWTVVGGRK